jgi:hypothetical protein
VDTPAPQTGRVWEADLGEPGRKLTLAELQALETMHLCDLLCRVAVATENMALQLSSLEGRFDRLERFLAQLDPARYPKGPDPLTHRALSDRTPGRGDDR